MGRYIYQVHIADGFVDDCDELMHRCSKVENLTYEAFTEIWKKMNFASLYKGRQLGAEVAELSEEVIHIAKRYMVANTSNFEESVAGLFLVYALLNIQPYPGFAVLRIVPEDVPAVSRIELVARRERRLDVLYILGTILIKGPTQYHAENREYGLEHPLRKYHEGCTSIDKTGVRPKGVFYRQNEELDIIRDLNNVTRLYENSKTKITDEYGRKDPNLSFVDKNLPMELDSTLKRLINGIIEDDKSGECMNINDRSLIVQSIKRRAMKSDVDPIKHLTGVRERKAKTSSSGHQKPDIAVKPGKVKSGSPTKPIATGSLNKRGRPPKTARKFNFKPKRKKSPSSSDSELSDTDLVVDDDDDELDDDLDVEDFQRNRIEIEISEINEMNNPSDEDSEKEYDVQIDSMPVIITSEHTQSFEIEIIDEYKNDNENAKRVDAKKMPEETSLVSLVNTPKSSAKVTPSTSKDNDEDTFKRPPSQNLRKRSKNELKKPALKSKFSKLGLEPVANFKDSKKPRKR